MRKDTELERSPDTGKAGSFYPIKPKSALVCEFMARWRIIVDILSSIADLVFVASGLILYCRVRVANGTGFACRPRAPTVAVNTLARGSLFGNPPDTVDIDRAAASSGQGTSERDYQRQNRCPYSKLHLQSSSIAIEHHGT